MIHHSPARSLTIRVETLKAILEATGERRRKWGEQDLPDGTGLGGDVHQAEVHQQICEAALRRGWCTYRIILAEEVAEAFAETDPVKLRAELVQATAVCIQWIESIDRRKP